MLSNSYLWLQCGNLLTSVVGEHVLAVYNDYLRLPEGAALLYSCISDFINIKKFSYSLVASIVSIKKRLEPNTSPLAITSLHSS